jgi:nucleoside diphosphate kinase
MYESIILQIKGNKNFQNELFLGPAVDAPTQSPDSIRGRFQSTGNFNPIHATDSGESFLREESIFFGDDEEQAIAVIKPDGIEKVFKKRNNDTMASCHSIIDADILSMENVF